MAKIKLQSISASSRWLKCTKSLEHNLTYTPNIHALKGNLIHKVSSLRLEEVFFDKNHEEEIESLKNNPYVDEQDKSLVVHWDRDCETMSDGYVQYAIRMAKEYEPHTIKIETKVWLKWYGHIKYGFIDLIMISDDYTIIIDLKTGRSRVDTEENSQMLMYAIGQIQDSNKKKENFVGKYILSVYQPIIRNVESYEYTLSQISRWYNSHILKMKEIISGDLQFDPSPIACKWCDYREFCNARIAKGVV